MIAIYTPLVRPSKEYMPLEQVVKTLLPNLTDQVQLASGEVEKQVQALGREGIKTFLNAMNGGRYTV